MNIKNIFLHTYIDVNEIHFSAKYPT